MKPPILDETNAYYGGQNLHMIMSVNSWPQLETAWKGGLARLVISSSQPTTQGIPFHVSGISLRILFQRPQCQFCNSTSKLAVP